MEQSQYNQALGLVSLNGNYCTRPHYPDDAVEHARQRRKQLEISIPAMEDELEKLKLEAHQLDKMLGALR